MKYKDLNIGDWFECDGYKYIKTTTPYGLPNMRLTANKNRGEWFGYCGSYFPQDYKINFLTSWEYNSTETNYLDGTPYPAEKAPYNLLLKWYGKKLFVVKKYYNHKDMFLVVCSNEPFFEAGQWYAFQEDIKLIYIDNAKLSYQECEKL